MAIIRTGKRWHSYAPFRLKKDAEKYASQIRRKSAHRKDPEFKVRIITQGRKGQRFPDRAYIVQWYGSQTAL